MDRPPVNPEKPKTAWHDAIMAERSLGNIGHDHSTSYLNKPLDKYVMYEQRENCLVLGDASHVVTKGLVEKKFFEHAVVVDSDPLVLDDYLFGKDDGRFTKIMSDFMDYIPPEDTFNFVYGKSVAFIPKEKISEFLSRIYKCLKKQGIFCSVLVGEKDTFRQVHYTKKEIEDLYKESNLHILDLEERPARKNIGLTSPGVVHEFVVVAKKGE